jgi:hypothetical protein
MIAEVAIVVEAKYRKHNHTKEFRYDAFAIDALTMAMLASISRACWLSWKLVHNIFSS